MGNNHEQYFGKNKRKVLLLGLSASGKTCTHLLTLAILNSIANPKNQSNQPPITKDLNIQDQIINDLNVTFFVYCLKLRILQAVSGKECFGSNTMRALKASFSLLIQASPKIYKLPSRKF